MKEQFENTDNVVPIERGIEIREERLSHELDSVEEDLRVTREQIADLNRKISEELQTERDDRTDGILNALAKKHDFLKEEEAKLLSEYDERQKKGDTIADQSMRLKEQREKQN